MKRMLPPNITCLHREEAFAAPSLPKGYNLKMMSELHTEGNWVDTFESHLQRNGQVLIQQGNQLKLFSLTTGLFHEQEVSNDWKFAEDLKGGAIGTLCQKLSRLRAFQPLQQIRVKAKSWRVLDDLGKTVLRLRSTEMNGELEVLTWIALEPLRGYEKEATAIFQRLEKAGYKAGAGNFFPMLGIREQPYSSKPDIQIKTDQPVVDSANQIVRAFVEVARKNERGMVKDLDTEFLHDYRVSLRRIRSLLSLFSGVYPEDSIHIWKTKLADTMKQTNRLRDLDVYLLDRARFYQSVPESMYAGLDVLFDLFQEERSNALEGVRALFQSLEYNQRMNAFAENFQSLENSGRGDLAQERTIDFANRLILKRYKKVAGIAGEIDDDTPDERVHELRIQCKKLRYLMEFFAGLYPDKTIKPLIKSLKGLQDVLGRFNDYSVQRESLSSFMETHKLHGQKGLRLAQSVGALVATLYQLQLKARGNVEDCISGFVNKRTRAGFEKLCL